MAAGSEELAREWYAAWGVMDVDRLRRILAPDFVHVSPFGRFDDRETYLAAVVPAARKSVSRLVVREVIARGDRAAAWFENRTPAGPVPSCDWFRVREGLIREVRSFYDSARVREVLSSEEQDRLDGSTR